MILWGCPIKQAVLAPVLICLIFVGKPVEANCAGFLFSVLELLKRCLKIKLCCLPFSFVVYVCGDVHIKQIVQAPIFICWLCLWGCPKYILCLLPFQLFDFIGVCLMKQNVLAPILIFRFVCDMNGPFALACSISLVLIISLYCII